MPNDLTKKQENEVLEILYELFPSMRNSKVNFVQVPNTPLYPQLQKGEAVTVKNNTDFCPVKKPSHYNQHGVEAIQAIEASMSPEEFKGYLKGSVMKYVWRYTYKGKAVEDLEKAQVYLGWLIERVKKNA